MGPGIWRWRFSFWTDWSRVEVPRGPPACLTEISDRVPSHHSDPHLYLFPRCYCIILFRDTPSPSSNRSHTELDWGGPPIWLWLITGSVNCPRVEVLRETPAYLIVASTGVTRAYLPLFWLPLMHVYTQAPLFTSLFPFEHCLLKFYLLYLCSLSCTLSSHFILLISWLLEACVVFKYILSPHVCLLFSLT